MKYLRDLAIHRNECVINFDDLVLGYRYQVNVM